MVSESRCRGFSILESRCRGFLPSEKMPWDHDGCHGLNVSVSRCPGVLVPESGCRSFFVLESRCRVFLVSWNLDVVVYVSPLPRFRFYGENRKNHRKLLQLYY